MKINAMADRGLFSKYKTAPMKEEREKARVKYWDKRGVPGKSRCGSTRLRKTEEINKK